MGQWRLQRALRRESSDVPRTSVDDAGSSASASERTAATGPQPQAEVQDTVAARDVTQLLNVTTCVEHASVLNQYAGSSASVPMQVLKAPAVPPPAPAELKQHDINEEVMNKCT
jgi:hypothetical protein